MRASELCQREPEQRIHIALRIALLTLSGPLQLLLFLTIHNSF